MYNVPVVLHYAANSQTWVCSVPFFVYFTSKEQMIWFLSLKHYQCVPTEHGAAFQIYTLVSEDRMRISIFQTSLNLVVKIMGCCRSSLKQTSKWLPKIIFKISHTSKIKRYFTCTQVKPTNETEIFYREMTIHQSIVSLCSDYEYLRNPSIFLSSTVRVFHLHI